MSKFDITALRATMADRNKALTATAELGKLGIQLSTPSEGGGKREDLERRAELRRASNALTAHAKAKPENLTDAVVDTLEYLNAEIALISNQLDLDEAAELAFTGRSGAKDSGLFDVSGNRIGTMLTAKDLSNEGAIAKKLGVHNREGDDCSLSDFVRGVAGMRSTESIRNSLSEGTDTAGGYAVPTVLLPGILQALVPASALLSAGANIANITDSAGSFTIAAVASIPTPAWRGELGAVTVAEPTFRALNIYPHSLAFVFKVSRELLMDSNGMDQALRTVIAQAFAKEMDRAGLLGNGVSPQPMGLANTPGINTVSYGVDGNILTSYTPFIRAARLIKETSAPPPNAVILSVRDEETIALFTDTTNQPLRRPDALQDMRFLATSQLPTDLTVGANDDCSQALVGDFSNFTFFMREGVSIQLLKELYAGTGEIGFLAHARIDCAVPYPSAFTVINGLRATT